MTATASRSASDPGLQAILQISCAVGSPAPVADVLAVVANRAAELVGARSAGIVLLEGPGSFRLAGAFGLSQGYGEVFTTAAHDLDATPVAMAVSRRRLVAVEDTEDDGAFRPWLAIARREGYRAIMAVPLLVDDDTIGGLVVYRGTPGRWSTEARSYLELIADHVAVAARTAQLIDDQKHRLTGLARLVGGLREQAHAHAERLHEIAVHVEHGNVGTARRFVAGLHDEHHATYAAVVERIHSPILAGLLLSEMSIARRRGVQLRVDRRSGLERIPSSLGESDALSIVSNLVGNALDAVSDLPASRRRVSLLIRQTPDRTVFRVRDWGRGIDPERANLLVQHGYTTKPDHAGVGLALVAAVAEASGGALLVEPLPVGARFSVTIPHA